MKIALYDLLERMCLLTAGMLQKCVTKLIQGANWCLESRAMSYRKNGWQLSGTHWPAALLFVWLSIRLLSVLKR